MKYYLLVLMFMWSTIAISAEDPAVGDLISTAELIEVAVTIAGTGDSEGDRKKLLDIAPAGLLDPAIVADTERFNAVLREEIHVHMVVFQKLGVALSTIEQHVIDMIRTDMQPSSAQLLLAVRLMRRSNTQLAKELHSKLDMSDDIDDSHGKAP